VCCDTGGGAVRVTNDRRDQTGEEGEVLFVQVHKRRKIRCGVSERMDLK
jgi:hypothetical protein